MDSDNTVATAEGREWMEVDGAMGGSMVMIKNTIK